MTRLDPAWRSVFAECRAIEAGHNARFDEDRSCFLVKSDSEPGRDREVRVSGYVTQGRTRVYVVFSCSCPAHRRRPAGGYGLVVCKHEAAVARRLDRDRLARWDRATNRWVATGTLREIALDLAAAEDWSTDPPATLSGPGIPDRSRVEHDMDRLASQIRAGL